MRHIVCLVLLYFCLFGADFITKSEHASMLYSNPRGIGCDKCHGKYGEGMLISTYKHFNKKTKQLTQEELRTPAINDLEFDKFKNAILNPKSVMPTYFLTDEEMSLIYEYVKNLKDKKENLKKGKKK
ncbi:c-type cytochrome [Campylobacter mucosalis]|uniref:c-type cytochrome n=1 Tax=Campylobacter mucosalis TaxID=202 RepID=UPI0014706B37|nr:c-type cytochrome [Campylobacter mucosalis]